MKNRQRFVLTALCAGLFVSAAGAADDGLLFDGAVGSTPVGRINNNGTPNDVADDFPVVNTIHDVTPGGAPWTIASFRANIRADGRISAKGEGLLLAGGNGFGTRGGPRQVLVSLFCREQPVPPATAGAATGPFNSEFVDLDPNGDFQIKGTLANADGAAPPVPCGDTIDNRPTLLIRTVAGGAPGSWFAAGILKD